MAQELAVSAALPSPTDIDKQVLSSLPRSVERRLVERWVDRSTPERGWDGEFTHYELRGLDPIPPEDVPDAIAVVNRALVPCESDLARQELVRLRVSTRSRDVDETELTLMLQVYGELCCEYPPDAVVSALRYVGRTEKFWPALSELKRELDRRVRKRRALLRVLEEARR